MSTFLLGYRQSAGGWLLGLLLFHGLAWADPGSSHPATGTGSITGRITDTDGQGIPWAVITALGVEGFFRCFSDNEGDYMLEDLPPGEYRVLFFTEGHQAAWYNQRPDEESADTLLVGPDQAVGGIDAMLHRLGTIRGRVTGAAGGGLAGIQVVLHRGGSVYLKLRTGADGAFQTPGVQPDRYRIQFVVPYTDDHLSEWYEDSPGEADAAWVEVPLETEVSGVDAMLDRGGAISGRVTDPSGQGVAGVSVGASGLDDWCEGETDEQGWYVISAVRPGLYRVSFSPPSNTDWIPEWYPGQPEYDLAEPITVQANQECAGIDARLELGGGLAGRVVDDAGNPIHSAQVGIRPNGFENGNARTRHATTNANGEWSIRGIPAGSWLVHFSHYFDEYVAVWYSQQLSSDSAQPLAVLPGQVQGSIDARMDRTATVSGRVTGPDGAGLADVMVETPGLTVASWSSSTTTDEEGNYTIYGVPPGLCRLWFGGYRAGDFASLWYPGTADPEQAVPLELESGQDVEGVDIQLPAGVWISGRVLDERDWWLGGIRIEAHDRFGQVASRAVSESGGGYQLHGLLPGPYRIFLDPSAVNADSSTISLLAAWYDGRDNYETAEVVTVGGEPAGPLDTHLDPAATISGYAETTTGQSMDGLIAYAYAEADPVAVAWEDSGNEFALKGLAAGTYRVFVVPWSGLEGGDENACMGRFYRDKPDRESADPITVTEGESVSIRVILPPCGSPPAPELVLPDAADPTFRAGWNDLGPNVRYELQEAQTPDFADPRVYVVGGTGIDLSHAVTGQSVFYYRLRAGVSCGGRFFHSEWSAVRAVLVTGGAFLHRGPGSASTRTPVIR